jgi:uncharacterized protein
MAPVIMVFAKAPVPGRVKTRLEPLLDPDAAAELYSCFVGDVLDALARFIPVAEIELHIDSITDAWRDFPYRRVLQREGDLGFRMLSAAEAAFEEGRQRVVILGSDAPNLPLTYIQDLLDSTADVAFGPAEDGGFYGISLKTIHPLMFEDVEWSTEFTLEQSIYSCEKCGLSVSVGREWFDIDSPADLVKLVTHPTPPLTTAWLKKHQFLIEKDKSVI